MLQSKYITKDDYFEYFGESLDMLEDGLNPSNKVNAFLFRLETRMASFIEVNFNLSIDRLYPQFTDYQKLHYKLALLEQAYYIIHNGEISTDSGYDPDKGEIADNTTLTNKEIAPNTKRELTLCGLFSRKLNSSLRYRGWWF